MARRGIVLIAWVAYFFAPIAGQTRPSGPAPGVLIDVGGYRLHLFCTGPTSSGAPTVVLDAGAGAFSTAWSAVQQTLPGLRTCAYDRAGWGWSEPGPGPRTITQEVFELHALLRAAGVPGPYVLVGHSYGGLLARRYAALHRDDVVGIVLVDPAHEESRLFYVKQGTWLRVREQSEGRAVPPPRALSPGDSTMSFYDPVRDYWGEEFQAIHDARIANPRMFRDGPLIVLAAGREDPPPGTSPEVWAELRAERRVQLADLTDLSSKARLISDPTSGHDMPKDNPHLIAACIANVVNVVAGKPVIDLAARCVQALAASSPEESVMPALPSSNPAQFVQGAPVLHVQDVKRTATFYRDTLGFTWDFGDETYAVVWRDNSAIHFVRDDGNPSGVHLFQWIKDVDAYHEELVRRGAHIASGPTDRPYGIREVAVSDVNGVGIVFGQDIDGD